MTVNCFGDNGAEDTTTYAPTKFGNLTLNVFSGDDCFKEATVIANKTNAIEINCNDADDDEKNNPNDEWYVYLQPICNCNTYYCTYNYTKTLK